MKQIWYVYIIQNDRNGTFYTGITTDIIKRILKHNTGKGAKFTRGRGKWNIVYSEQILGNGEALKREYSIKKLTRNQKINLILDSSTSQVFHP